MTVCDGRGAGTGHCCWITGQQCSALVVVDGQARCSLYLKYGDWPTVYESSEWQSLPAGSYYEDRWPGQGYGCGDWPQNIPEVMAAGIGLCCWQDGD
jgi:hypothetical protein